MRTIVVSDLHGQPQLLTNALEHSGFDGDKDKLVVAGDTCDIGAGTMELHEMLFGLGATQLIGNHEMSHLCRIDIRPYDVSLDPDYIGFIAIGIKLGHFALAHAVDDVLITHAGLSKRLAVKGVTERGREDSFFSVRHHAGTLTASLAAELFNERLKSTIDIDEELLLLDVKPDPMWTDWFYPFWFRPYESPDCGQVSECGFYDGFKQVIGHTPWGAFTRKQQRLIYGSGVTIIDPYARKHRGKSGHCKYAVIEDGTVTYVCPSEGR